MEEGKNFVHLHVHSHFSILDGMSKVPDIVAKAVRLGMPAIALTDHGNMFGIKEFTDEINKVNGAIKKKIGDCKEELGKCKDEAKKAELQKKIEDLEVQKANYVPFKAIVGVEAYCARRSMYSKDKNFKQVRAESGREYIVDSSGWHLILLAKNKKGYQNLCKLVSLAWIDGFYNRPRIDKQLLEKYHEGVIVCSACLGGELPQLIMDGKPEEAEKSMLWFKNLLGEDYYVEIQRHKTNKPGGDTNVYLRQSQVNPVLIDLARRNGIKIIASNDCHFVEESHAEAHDRLICLSTGQFVSDEKRMHYTKQEWIKSQEEMYEIFSDIPEALENTLEIAAKVEPFSIESDPIMPKFPIPEEFGSEEEYRKRITEQELFDEFTRDEKGNVVLSQEAAEAKIRKLGGYDKLYRVKFEADYLAKLAWEGAHRRYGETLTEEQIERITFELHIMKTMGFPGYFLIVSDYIRAAREELGVSVGPGRGSAAGSVVAYCLHITDLDPLKYDLLFERFLNPDRISLPDIDVDFDDDGRPKVLDWVTEKYGREKVAHIITYGTMATKSSIKDVGRVQEVPLPTVNSIVKLVPDKFGDDLKDPVSGKVPKVNVKNCLKYVQELSAALNGDDENVSSMLNYAKELEGTVRQTGIHACGVIIGSDDLTNFAPLSTIFDKKENKDIMVTQYDGHVVESVGLIKMDFLGLSTLSIIKEALKNIKKSQGIDVDIDAIPIDDELTYALYSSGSTVATFQFESPGMQKYLRELHPSVIGDIIAMNALYRPGPMDNIPSFIRRKQGKEEIVYPLPCMEKYLSDTYGITVYQEQVMLLSREIADFTRGESDTLRKAMGKKQIAKMEELFGKFMSQGVPKQCKLTGRSEADITKTLTDIWEEWKKFASYAFNKSHAACYAWVSYQTAYLKAHYPVEYMAANLTRSMDNISDVTKFMEECKNMGITVLSPDVNESDLTFTPTKDGNIRFGLGGVKGVGEGAVEAIVKEREANGPYTSVFDFFERINMASCNKKVVESLVLSGAFDGFEEVRRETFFTPANSKGESFLDVVCDYAQKYSSGKNSLEGSLFGDLMQVEIAKPKIPVCQPFTVLERLKKEKDKVGIYLSDHPLSEYEEVMHWCNAKLKYMSQPVDKLLEYYPKGSAIRVCGIVTSVTHAISKNGKPYCQLVLEDYSGSYKFGIFGKIYERYLSYCQQDLYLMITGQLIERYAGSKFAPKNGLGDIEYRIDKIEYMTDLKALKWDLNLTIPITCLNADLVSMLAKYVDRRDVNAADQSDDDVEFRGIPSNLSILISDEEDNVNVNLKGRDRIFVDKTLIRYLDSIAKPVPEPVFKDKSEDESFNADDDNDMDGLDVSPDVSDDVEAEPTLAEVDNRVALEFTFTPHFDN